jgi:hypothetical protein
VAVETEAVPPDAVPTHLPSGPAMSVDDVPLKANNILNIVVTQNLKLKKFLSQIHQRPRWKQVQVHTPERNSWLSLD